MKKIVVSVSVFCIIALAFSSCKKIEENAPAINTFTTTSAVTTTVPTETTTEATTTVTTVPPDRNETISFLAVGDNLIHSSIYNQAFARGNEQFYDFEFAYKNVADLIEQAEISVINQETLICNDVFEPSTYPRFNSPNDLGDYMIDIGFDVFTIANNHTLDKGTDGLSACFDYWDSKKPDVITAGAYRNSVDKENIRILERDSVAFSFLSYTEFLNGLSLPNDSEMIIGDVNKIDEMIADVKSAKEISDICVVSLHWGTENSDVISSSQRDIAKQLSNAGADIIIGTHPHVLRDIEIIERDDGTKTICAYSLGNFISAQSVGQNLIGGILQFDINVKISGETGELLEPFSFENIELVPTVTHYEYPYSDVRLYKFSDYTEELALKHGVKSPENFTYSYICEILQKNISPEFLSPTLFE